MSGRSDTGLVYEIPPRDLGGTGGGTANTELILEDLHNFGADYDPTLMAWHANFTRAWPDLKPRYGDRFGRMWQIYLLLCAAAFRSRRYQLWQVVLSPGGITGGYQRPALHAAPHPQRAPVGASA
jgi:cyclopropane-fatty-acyl-phospholipid synthase